MIPDLSFLPMSSLTLILLHGTVRLTILPLVGPHLPTPGLHLRGTPGPETVCPGAGPVAQSFVLEGEDAPFSTDSLAL